MYYIGGEKALLGTPYGLTALAKIVFVAALLNLGAFNRYVSVPALERWAGLPPRKPGIVGRAAARLYSPFAAGRTGHGMALFFKRAVRAEMFLAVSILFCAALLGHETPARHAIHMRHMGQAAGRGHDAMQNMGGM